jgi:GNAT superfamily N-acetyltransferase
MYPGQTQPGNVDLFGQPKVKNPDGSTSTVDSIGVNIDGQELLLPTVTPDGRHFRTAQEAIDEYKRTRRHLGVFATQAAADAAGQQLHEDYAAGKFERRPGTPPAVGTVPGNDPAYGLSGNADREGDRLQAAVTGATQTPAQQAQRILSLQIRTGLPAEVIERNLDTIEKQAAQQDFDPVKFRKESPLLASWLEQHPLNGPAAQKDLPPLTATERALQVVKHTARVGTASFYRNLDLGAWSGLELVGDLLIKVNPGSPVGYWLREQGQTLNKQAEVRTAGIKGPEPQDPGTLERAAYSASESVGMSAPTLAASVLLGGGPAVERLSLGMMGAQTGLPAYSEARAKGKGVAESFAFGASQGAVEAWTEALPLHTLLGNLAARKGFLTTTLKQMLPEVAGEEIATALQDLNEWATLHPDRPFSEYAKARPQAFVDTALATILATGAQTGALHGVARVLGGLTTGPTLEHLGEQTKGTELAKGSPGAYEDYIRHVTQDGGAEVYAPIETWDSYWQSKGVDPVAQAAEVTGDPTAYERAVVDGRDLAIPTGRFLTQIAGTEHNAFFKDEIRLGIDNLNTREAKEALDNLGKSGPSGGNDVEDLGRTELVRRLVEGGQFTPAQAEKQANLVLAAVSSIALRKGADPAAAAQILLDRLGISRPEAAPASEANAAITELGQPSVTDPNIARLVDAKPADQRSVFEQMAEAGAFAGDRTVRGIGGLEQEGPQGLSSIIKEGLFARLVSVGQATEQRKADVGPAEGTTERRGAPLGLPATGPIGERFISMLKENPAIIREAAAMQARAGARHPTATFLGYGPDGPLYNVQGGPFDKSTKSVKGLTDLGIAIPDTPADTGERLNGAQLREMALKQSGQEAPARVARLTTTAAATPASVHEFAAQLRDTLGPAVKTLDLELDGAGDLHVASIVVAPTAQGAGIGSRVLKSITKFADAHLLRTVLTPTPLAEEGSTDAERLAALYRRFGFLDNAGDTRNFNVAAGMYRDPRIPTPAQRTETFFQARRRGSSKIESQSTGDTFYSRIVRAVQESKQAAGPGSQWKAAIKNAKGGINADEFAITRVADLEDGKRYTKEEVLTYLAANELKVEDVTLGGEGGQTDEEYEERLEERTDEIYDRMVDEAVDDYIENYESEIGRARAVSEEEEVESDEEDADGNPIYDTVTVWYAYVGRERVAEDEFFEDEESAQDAAERERDKMEERERENLYENARDYVDVDRDDARQQAEEELGRRGEVGNTRTRYGSYVLPGGEEGSYREVFLTMPSERIGGPSHFNEKDLKILRRVTGLDTGETTLVYDGRTLGTFPDNPMRGILVRMLDGEGEELENVPPKWFDRAKPDDPAPNIDGARDRANREAAELRGRIEAARESLTRDLERASTQFGRPIPEPDLEPRTVEVVTQYRQLSDEHWQEVAEAIERKRQSFEGRPGAIAVEGWVDGHDEYEGIDNPIVRLRFNSRTTKPTYEARALEIRVVPQTESEQFAYGNPERFEVWPEGSTDVHQSKRFFSRERAQEYIDDRKTYQQLVAGGEPIMFIEEVQTPHPGEFDKMPELFQKNWRQMAFKWALRYAVAHDMHAIAWTTGKQQSDRYSLEREVESIGWAHPEPVASAQQGLFPEIPIVTGEEIPLTKDGRASLVGEGARMWVHVKLRNGNGVQLSVDTDQKIVGASPSYHADRLIGRTLREALGDDLAKRIASEQQGEVSGTGVAIGGAGLKRLYDYDFVNVVNGLPAVKRNGGKVAQATITLPDDNRPSRDYVGPDLTLEQLREKLDEQTALTGGEGEGGNDRQYRHNLHLMIRQLEREGERNDNRPWHDAFMEAIRDFANEDTVLRLGGRWVMTPHPGHTQPALVITPEMRESILGGQPLFQDQPAQPDRRGFIQFGPGDRINIGLLPAADLSTFLHETGHLFLKLLDEAATELKGLDPAGLTATQQKLLLDHATLMKWLGVEESGAITTAAHEKMAEGFETYLREGRAPSLELSGAFATFRTWLNAIYRALTRMNVQLTPEVRGVFDRLIATDAAIAEAEAARGHAPLFATAADMGVTPAEFELYVKATEQDRFESRAALDRRLIAEAEREKAALWNAQRAATRDTVKKELGAQPVYRSLAAMQYGTDPFGDPIAGVTHDGPLRLSKALLLSHYGEARVRELQRVRPFIYQLAEGGLDADYVAELTGFSSGDEMLKAVVAAPEFRVAIENETNARMVQQAGSIQNDGTLPEVAQADTANLYHEEVLRLELKALNKLRQTVSPFVRLQQAISKGESQPVIDALTKEVQKLKESTRRGAATVRAGLPNAEALRELAEKRIGSLPIGQIKAQAFWSTARRASQTAVEKAARQDFDGAIIAKQQEILNLALYREASRVNDEIDARVDAAKRLDTPASRKRIGLAGGSYQDQIDGILDRFEFATVSQKALDRRASLAKWAAGLEAQGIPVDLPDGLLDEARRVNYKQLTVDEFMGVTDGLKQIEHLARLKNALLEAKDEREFSALRDKVADSILATNAPRIRKLVPTPADRRWRKISNYFAQHTKMSNIAQALDGFVDGGPMWTAFMWPLNRAAAAEEQRSRAEGTAYVKLFEEHYPGRKQWDLHARVYVPALDQSITKEFAIAVAQNWGNEQGRERLLNDPVRHFDDAKIAAILDLLDENDWKFVQAHWDFLDHFWPEIEAKTQRVTGVPPEKVAAVPVVTKYGIFKGGYHPLKYDATESPRAQQFAAAEAGKLMSAGAYIRSTTRRGHLKTRVEHAGLPVKLDMSVAFAHIDQVIHDLTHHEMLIDVNRLLRDPKVSKAIYDTQGDQIYEQLKDGLEDVARGSLQGPGRPSMMDKGFTWLRQRTQLAMLGLNLWTAVQQPLGMFNGMNRVGVKWVARGMSRWLRDAASMESTTQWIASVSPMMAGRVTTATADLHDLHASLSEPGGWFDKLVRTVSSDTLTQQALTESFLWHISMAQRVADVPTWLGQYEKSMAGGESEERAIALADQAVLDSQGGGQIKDLAKVQRGGPVARAFMTFASYGVTVFNSAQRTVGIAQREGFKDPAAMLRALGNLGLLYTVPAIATIAMKHAFGRGGADDDPLNWFQQIGAEMISSAMSGLIFMREISGAVQIALGLDPGARGYSGPAALRPFQVTYDVATQIKQGEGDRGFWHAINSGAGFLFAYPAAQVQKTADGAIALYEGRTKNPAALIFGPPPKGK